jgi:hypothetical protein
VGVGDLAPAADACARFDGLQGVHAQRAEPGRHRGGWLRFCPAALDGRGWLCERCAHQAAALDVVADLEAQWHAADGQVFAITLPSASVRGPVVA